MLRKFIPMLLVLLLLLPGCVRAEETEPTAPPTEAATVPPETVPETQAPEKPAMEAEDLYWKMKNAVGSQKMYQFTSTQETRTEIGSAVTETTVITRVKQASPPVQIYVETETIVEQTAEELDYEASETVRTYVQVEDGKPVVYYHSENADAWLRYVDDVAPSEYLKIYTQHGLPYTVPEMMSLDPGTKMVGDREVYVLRCRLTTLEAMGTYMEGVEVDTVYYVDVDTFIPFQIRRTYLGMDVLMTDAVAEMMEAMGAAGDPDQLIDSFEYREVIDRISYEPVEVPGVPSEGIEKSIDITEEYSEA